MEPDGLREALCVISPEKRLENMCETCREYASSTSSPRPCAPELAALNPEAQSESLAGSNHCGRPCWRRFVSSRLRLLMKGSPKGQKS